MEAWSEPERNIIKESCYSYLILSWERRKKRESQVDQISRAVFDLLSLDIPHIENICVLKFRKTMEAWSEPERNIIKESCYSYLILSWERRKKRESQVDQISRAVFDLLSLLFVLFLLEVEPVHNKTGKRRRERKREREREVTIVQLIVYERGWYE